MINQNNNRPHNNYGVIQNKRYQSEKLRRSSSMVDIHIINPNSKKNIIQNINTKNYSKNMIHSNGNSLERRYKYYDPRRYDYEGSCYGDETYNYYLNSPMRGDISADWKFPPLYCYNYRPK